MPLGQRPQSRTYSFDDPLDSDEGWAKYNQHFWRRDYEPFLSFFFGEAFTERHSTKPIEDAVGWGLETDPETLIATDLGPGLSKVETLDARRPRLDARLS